MLRCTFAAPKNGPTSIRFFRHFHRNSRGSKSPFLGGPGRGPGRRRVWDRRGMAEGEEEWTIFCDTKTLFPSVLFCRVPSRLVLGTPTGDPLAPSRGDGSFFLAPVQARSTGKVWEKALATLVASRCSGVGECTNGTSHHPCMLPLVPWRSGVIRPGHAGCSCKHSETC